jgi:hypothetical protein
MTILLLCGNPFYLLPFYSGKLKHISYSIKSHKIFSKKNIITYLFIFSHEKQRKTEEKSGKKTFGKQVIIYVFFNV